MSHHPVVLGRMDTPLRGVWVRHKTTGYDGYVSHVERIVGQPPKLWIVYPPGRLDDGTRVKTWSAGSALASEVKRLPKYANFFEEEE